MKKLLFSLLIATGIASAQACPGGFWGNGQCIGACDSPLINPNVDLKFYSWSCLGGTRQICTDGGVFCYPEYTAYDRIYGQYCGVITDYGDGECTFPYLGLGQQVPKRKSSVPIGILMHKQYELLLAQARPGAKCIRTKKYLKYRKVNV